MKRNFSDKKIKSLAFSMFFLGEVARKTKKDVFKISKEIYHEISDLVENIVNKKKVRYVQTSHAIHLVTKNRR